MSVSRELVAKLYVATFNRAPDKAGLDYWVNNSGLAIEQIAQSFFDQAETQAAYPAGTTSAQFVTAIYNNLFDRAPDAAGLAYWVAELDAGHLTKDVMILAVINGALGADATILENKADVGIYYADALNLEGADFSLSGVTADASSVVDAMKAAGDLVNNNEIDPAAFNGYSAVYTLQKVVGSTTTEVEGSGSTETYWGNGECENCAMTIGEFYEMVETVTGLDLALLGLADINAEDPINDVAIVEGTDSSDVCCPSLVVTTSAGEQFTSELAIAQEYIAFLDSLIYYTDENGNKISRFTTKTTTETSEVTTYDITPIVLTPTVNNGTTFETGFTTSGNDLIVAGQTELLHGAYIDAGSGSINTLEVDMKGGYAQPIQLLNIQEIHVQNLPNVYENYYNLPADDNADGTDIPDYLGSDGMGGNSILDLSRANSLGKLIINEGIDYPDVEGSGTAVLGSLTVVGVRNDAILRLEGGFSRDVTVQYGQGLDGTLDIELALGDVTADINLLQNAAVLNIHSDGVENHMHQFFAGGSISRMYITGPAAFGVDEDLSESFNSGRPAIIDARQNDGGIDVTLNDHYNVKVYGTTDADDEITAQDSGQVMINAYNGSNVIDVDGSEYVSITTGTGNDSISAEDGIEVYITAGDGKNIITTDGSATVEITSGSGNDVINANDGVSVTIDAGAGNNVINANGAVFGDTFGTAVVSITTGDGNDTISAVRNDVVTIDAGNGTNKITVSAFEINITTGTGSDTVTISGMDTEFVNGDDSGDWNDDNYEVGVSDSSTPGALLNLDLGSGTNTIVLGRDVDLGFTTVEYGITALEGSVISGSGIKFVVENDSDITEVDLSGATVASVQLKEELTITAEQFEEIGADAFSVYRSAFGATEDLNIVVTSDVTLSDLVNLAELSSAVRLNFEIRNGATLTLSAEELHKYVAWHGIDSTDGLNGKVVITDAGYSFDAFDNGPNNQVIDGGSLSDSFSASGDVTILRNAEGFNRPSEAPSTDTTTIDSSVTPVVTDPVIVDGGNPTTLQIVGTEDIVFESYIDLGDGSTMGNVIDFSELDGTVTGMTVKNFDNIASVSGNNTGTRIDVEMTGNVGTDEQGLVSSGVETYVVTAIVDNDDNDGDANTDTATFYFCDETQDVEVVGLKGNADKTLTIANVPWGLVAPSILLEGDGYADWNGGLKADGNPDASDIGTVVVEYFTAGAPAVVNINNAGVELGVTSTGAERGFAVAGIELENAISLSLNVTEGDAVIDHISGSIETLTIDATEDVSVTGVLPSTLTVIDASAVDGMFSALVSPADDFVFTGAAGGSDLAIDSFTATADTSIDGGTAGVVLTIIGAVDLEEATLANVEAVVLTDGSSLNLTMAQADAIGAANFSVVEGGAAALNLSGLDGEPFALANYADGITVDVVSIAALPVVTLHATTDLTGIASLEVPEGTVLNLTAAQYQQLDGAGSITGLGSVNITNLTQADVEGGFDLSGVTATALTLTMDESVALVDTDDLGNFAVVMGDDMSLTLADIAQADGVSITGGANSALIFTDTNAGAFDSIDASGFAVTELHMLNLLVASRNVDLMFSGLSESVTKVIYTGQGWVDGVNQTVVLEEGTTITSFVVFNKPEGDVEIENFTLDMMGGTEIDGNLRLSSSVKEDAEGNDLIQTHLKTLTINSNGTAANLLNGETANVITGDVTSQGTGNQGSYVSVDNNLLDVTINADQELIVEGDIVFESVVGDDDITANDDEEAIAVLTVNGTADVTLGGIDILDDNDNGASTDDDGYDINGLNVVNNGTGTVSLTIDATKVDDSQALSFTGSGDIVLAVEGAVDLSNDNLSSVTQITINDGATLTLTQAQLEDLALVDAETAGSATLNLVEFGSDPFDATTLPSGIDLDTITMAAGNITLDPATNLTGVDEIIVPEGGTLSMTAAQFQQLAGAGTITGTDITVNIIGLTQADVDAGFDLSDVDGDITITLGEPSVDLGTFEDGVLVPGSEAVLNGASFTLADNQTLGLVNDTQADGLDVDGGINSTIVYKFAGLQAFPAQIDASGYNVTTLKALAASFSSTPLANVEYSIDDLPSSVELRLYEDPTDLGFLDPTFRRVVIEEGITTPAGGLSFNDWDATDEVRTLDLTLEGDVVLNGDLKIPTRTDKDGTLVQQYFETLTIHSEGTLINTIDGDISTATPAPAPNTSENNLLNIIIDAQQDLEVTGAIDFNSIDVLDDDAVANLTISGIADVTVETVDVSDVDIATLNITNNSTGVFTVTGASPSVNADMTETIVLAGTGAMTFGTVELSEDNADGINGGGELSVIDASALSGALYIENLVNIDTAEFIFTAGTGVTNITLGTDGLNSTGLDTTAGTLDDTAGWLFDMTDAADGSELHLIEDFATAVGGSKFTVLADASTTIYVDATMDLSDLVASLPVGATIVVADGATLTLTAAQADGLTIIGESGVASTGVVNIADLGDLPVDLSGIDASIAGTTFLEDNDVTLDVATDLGAFSITLDSMVDTSASLAGQTIRLQNVDQAERAIIVNETANGGTDNNDSSTNVVWLFESVPAPVDTAAYDGAIGRVWLPEALVSSANVEDLYTTLPSSILRVDFGSLTDLNILLLSNAIDRVMEISSFNTVEDLDFNDIGLSPVEHLQSLTLHLGGQVTVGDIVIDDIVPAGYDTTVIDFNGITINSHRSVKTGDLYATEGYVNDNDGYNETAAASGTGTVGLIGNENTAPINMNTVGDLSVGADNGLDLLTVNLNTLAVTTIETDGFDGGAMPAGAGAALTVGTITYETDTAASTALLDITGDNNITITAVNTVDADITSLTLDATGFTATLDPVMNMDDTEEMTITNGNVAAGTIILSEVEGNELSSIDSSAFDGTLTMTLSQIDSTNEDRTLVPDGDTTDPEDAAFTFTSGSGVTTVTVAALSETPTLTTDSEWVFDYTNADTGSSLTIDDSTVFQAGAILTLINVPVIIEGDVDFSDVVLNITGGSIWVPDGQSLTLTIDQVDYLHTQNVDVVGSGTTYVVGDGTDHDLTTNADVLQTMGVDYSGVTLDTTLPLPQDADGRYAFTVYGAEDDNGDPAIQNIVGTDYGDDIDESLSTIVGATVTGGLGDDAIDSSSTGGSTTFYVDAGTDTITGMWTDGTTVQDVLVVSNGATANAIVVGTSSFIATADTMNAGTANISKASGTTSNTTLDLSLAGGPNGYNLTGSDSATAAIDTLIGSDYNDVINGGNNSQTAAAAIDILTGNDGADQFVFDVQISSAATLTAATTTAAIDREDITITADAADNDDETMTVNYTVDGVADLVAVNLSALNATDANAIATEIAAALEAKAGISAIAAANVITVAGDSGASLTIGAITYGGTTVELNGTASNGTDVAQVSTLTVSGTPTSGDLYSLIASGFGGGDTASAIADATPTTDEIAAGLATNYATAEIADAAVGSVITFTDSDADNGGFSIITDTTAAFGGSGASEAGAVDRTTADQIMDFVSGEDTISFGLAAGVNGSNYAEGAAAVADYATALADANTACDGTIQYYMTSVTADNGFLFFDANLDGNVDGVVELVGLTRLDFAAGDIVA